MLWIANASISTPLSAYNDEDVRCGQSLGLFRLGNKPMILV